MSTRTSANSGIDLSEWIPLEERPLPAWGPYDFSTRVDLLFFDGSQVLSTPAGIWNWSGEGIDMIVGYRRSESK